MTIKQAFEYLASECGIGMKNPFIALRNLVEGFSKVANELDPTPTGDFVKKSGDTMTGPLVVEDDVTATRFKFVEPVLGGSINLYGRASTQESNIEVPNKSGTVALTNDIPAPQLTSEVKTGMASGWYVVWDLSVSWASDVSLWIQVQSGTHVYVWTQNTLVTLA